MDPLSIGVAATDLTDVLRRCSTYVDGMPKSRGRTSGEFNALVDALRHGINDLIRVNESIESLNETFNDVSVDSQTHTSIANQWRNAVEQNRQSCKVVFLRLEGIFRYILGEDGTLKKTEYALARNSKNTENGQSETAGYMPGNKQNRALGKFGEREQIRRTRVAEAAITRILSSLQNYHTTLQELLSNLNLIYIQGTNEATETTIDGFSTKMNALQSKLEIQIKSLGIELDHENVGSFWNDITTPTEVYFWSPNQHFFPPQAVTRYFTGRETLLEELGMTLNGDLENGTQKRFVVQGFWGVFSINGASYDTAKEGFAAISKIGGVEPNERAAKAWLSGLEQSWLLIIDNVDDPSVDLTRFFPAGERGFILITTRVLENVRHGTVGPKSYHFEKLERNAAACLLLEIGQIEKPWDQRTIDQANSIALALGDLPLALVHAGAAIANHLCELESYMVYHRSFCDAIRQNRNNKRQLDNIDDNLYMSVYSSYEVIYRKLDGESTQKARDAVELLKIFAFLNREDIRITALVAAAKNPLLESAAKEKAEQEKKSGHGHKPLSWTQHLRRLLYFLFKVLMDRSQPVLPRILGDVLRESQNVAKFEFRLRQALHLLTQWSLVSYQEDNDSYSMHPLVHLWVRERPQMTLGEQAVWSQATANALGQSIVLPIDHSATTAEMEFQRSLLLHVIHLRGCKVRIRERYCENHIARRRLFFPVREPASDLIVMDFHQAMQSTKFSYIYFICGYFHQAEKLQEAARDFLVPNIGLEHELSMRLSLFLAKTYWLGRKRFNDAATLTEQVLQSAQNLLGNQHNITLNAIDELGMIRLYQGRFPEAENLLQQAIKGRTDLNGPKHQDTLSSIDNLGHVYWSMSAFEKAKHQHLKAIDGMASHSQMGPDHERTLAAKENLALAYREAGELYYAEAHELMEEVVAKRSTILGRESPYTLMAKSNLAYVKLAMGACSDAEQMIREVLPIATRNLGSDHPGVWAMKRRLADILAVQKKDHEAEKIVVQVLDRNKYVDGHDISRRQVETIPDGDNYSEISDRSRTSSIASIFSNVSLASGSSMSSLAGSPGSIERLVALLLVDDKFKRLCIKALATFSQKDVEKRLRRLLKEFGVELRKEATTSQQRRAAQFVRVRARNTAHMVCNALKPDSRVTSLAMPKAEPLEVDLDDSPDSERSDEELEDLQQLDTFIKISRAVTVLRESLRAFVYPNEAQIKSYMRGERAYPTQCLCQTGSLEGNSIQFTAQDRQDETLRLDVPPSHTIEQIKSQLSSLQGPGVEWQLLVFGADKFEDGISFVQYNLENGDINVGWESGRYFQPVESLVISGHRLLFVKWLQAKSGSCVLNIQRLSKVFRRDRPTVAEGKTRVEWQCECGHKSSDDFVELKKGAAKRYRQAFNCFNSSSTSTRNPTSSRISQILSGGLQSLRGVLAGRAGKSSHSDLPLHERQGPDNQLDHGNSQPLNPTLPQQELLFLLLCYSQDRYATRLLQLDLVTLQATSDKALFKILRDNYHSMKGILVSYLSLRDSLVSDSSIL